MASPEWGFRFRAHPHARKKAGWLNCRVYDRGSTNGTFVNGVRVTERALDHGTTVRIGSTDLRFLVQQ